MHLRKRSIFIEKVNNKIDNHPFISVGLAFLICALSFLIAGIVYYTNHLYFIFTVNLLLSFLIFLILVCLFFSLSDIIIRSGIRKQEGKNEVVFH